MRWTDKYRKWRYIKRFAFLPIKIGRETRWLETVYILQHRSYAGDGWKNWDFCEKEAYEKKAMEDPKWN